MQKENLTGAELWNACESVIQEERKPLEIWRVAKTTGLTEDQIISILIKETGRKRQPICFRYPPFPNAAITGIGEFQL